MRSGDKSREPHHQVDYSKHLGERCARLMLLSYDLAVVIVEVVLLIRSRRIGGFEVWRSDYLFPVLVQNYPATDDAIDDLVRNQEILLPYPEESACPDTQEAHLFRLLIQIEILDNPYPVPVVVVDVFVDQVMGGILDVKVGTARLDEVVPFGAFSHVTIASLVELLTCLSHDPYPRM